MMGIESFVKYDPELDKRLGEKLNNKDIEQRPDLGELDRDKIEHNRRWETKELEVQKPDISYIEATSREALLAQNKFDKLYNFDRESPVSYAKAVEGKAEHKHVSESKQEEVKQEGLTEEEKAKIKEETGWSDEIIDNIKNMKQYEVLKKANLKEVEINGRKCLVKKDIDLDYTDEDGISNRDRIAAGQAPIDSKTGKPIELHHLGQKEDSPLVELTEEEHRTGEYENGKKNQSLWHDNTKATEVHGEGNNWHQERKAHWKARSEQLGGK